MKEYYRYRDDPEVLATLERIEEFGRFSRAELQSMLKLGRLVRFEPGEYIIRQGELDCWIYFLLSGLLEVVRDDHPIAYIRKRCELFGEISVIDAAPRSTSVRARKPSMVLGVDASLLDRGEVEDATVFRATLYKAFSEILAERVRRLTDDNSKLRAALSRYQAAAPPGGKAAASGAPAAAPAAAGGAPPAAKAACSPKSTPKPAPNPAAKTAPKSTPQAPARAAPAPAPDRS